MSYGPTAKKAALTPHASYTETVEGSGSGDAKDNAGNSLVEDMRGFIAGAKRPTPPGRVR